MIKFKKYEKHINALLEDLEYRIDPATEDEFNNQWHDFLYGQFAGEIFSPVRGKVSNPSVRFMDIHLNDALEDNELMLIRQLQWASNAISTYNTIPAMLSDYGTGIMSSVFGADIYVMPRSMNTPPTTIPLGEKNINQILEQGIPNLENGFGQRVFEMGEIYKEILKDYPNISRYVHIYHPDLQGPVDVLELLLGSDMYYVVYDEPETVHALMRLITDTTKAMFDRWYQLFPGNTEMTCHYGRVYHRGKINLRMDTAMNFSPDHYEEFIYPYYKELYDTYGGGIAHFCGKGDHYIEKLCSIPGVYGVNMTQPQYNNMELIYRNTVEKGIKLLSFDKKWAYGSDKARAGGYYHNLHVYE